VSWTSRAVTIAILAAIAPVASSQAPLESQGVHKIDVCEGQSPQSQEELTSCAQNALFDDNWPAFLKWAQRAAKAGDSTAAFWLALEYQDPGPTGAPTFHKNLVRAYMWYDIAAELHARKIRTLAVTSGTPETNELEINYRNAVGQDLTRVQIAAALRLESDWWRAISR